MKNLESVFGISVFTVNNTDNKFTQRANRNFEKNLSNENPPVIFFNVFAEIGTA